MSVIAARLYRDGKMVTDIDLTKSIPHVEKQGDDVYFSLYMPALVVGTVGGGTSLPSFRVLTRR